MKKKILSMLVIVALLLMSLGIPVVAAANQTPPSKMLSKEAFKQQIDLLEQGLARAEDGTLSLTVSPAVEKELGMTSDDVNKFKLGLDNINRKVKKGELVTTKNFTIYEKNDTSFVIQGGVDIFDLIYWWGCRDYYSTYTAYSVVNTANKVSQGLWAATVVFSPYLPLSIINAVGAAWFGWYGGDLSYVNSMTSRGVISDVNWVAYYSIYSQ